MISEATGNELLLERREQSVAVRLSRVLSIVVCVALLAVMIIGVVPYGGAEFWWKAFLTSAVFSISILALLEMYLTDSWRIEGGFVLVPAIALAAFAWLQTISLGDTQHTGLPSSVWNSISADPFSTRFFVLQLLALVLAAAMLYRHANTDLRMITILNLIIGIAVVSAIYGILRQTTQHSLGFGLPLLKVDQGYGQFINKNHFAYLMEMGFGLTLGITAGGGVKRDRGLIYLGALLPIWTALVLSNSRGGILAMLAQIVSAVLLFTFVARRDQHANTTASHLRGSIPARVGLVIVLVAGVMFGTLWMGGDRLATKLEQANHEFDPAAAEIRQNARRNQIWRATWHMFAAHPIAGTGLGAYWIAIPEYHDASGTMTPQEAHNDYLELLASGGLVGFALGVWFVVLVVRRVQRNLNIEDRFRRAAVFGAMLGLVGIAVHSLVDFGLHVFGNAILFTALLVIATAYPPKKRGAIMAD